MLQRSNGEFPDRTTQALKPTKVDHFASAVTVAGDRCGPCG